MGKSQWRSFIRPSDEPFPENLRCSFCHKDQEMVRKLVLGPTPDIAICDECAELVREAMERGKGDV